jgi:trk system potassium uptake protein TrkA
MKVIICGGGQVGYNIADYLSREKNDVTVIDPDPQRIAAINNSMDANGIIGFPSHPDTLKEAGLADADVIIAVTDVDEVNMIACQVAHSLFGVPKKIARIQTTNYLDPTWANLFARAHMPIDVIISPETEVAEAILRRVKVPGTSDIIPMVDGEVFLVGVHCEANCPIVNTPLRQLRTLFPDINAQILAIIRGKERILVHQDNQFLVGDEVYFLVKQDHLQRALTAFGHEEPAAHNIIIFGGGNIGMALAKRIKAELKKTNIKVIELKTEQAEFVSEKLPDVIVLNGNGLDKDILEEANITGTETFISVSNDDENNILASLLAKQYGCNRTIALINKKMYADLTSFMGIDALVSPRTITVSKILQHIRKGRIRGAYNIYDGFAEVIEAEVSATASITNKTIMELNLPDTIRIGGIWRDNDFIIPKGDTLVLEKDIIIVIAAQENAHKVEKLFSVNIDILGI